MRIFFSCTTIKFDEYKKYYFKIRDFLIAEGHVLTRDWLTNLHDNSRSYEAERNGTREIYRLTLEALNKADALIIENTVESFSNGHLITIALQRRIPVLVLYQDIEERYFPNTLINSIEDNFLRIEKYNGDKFKEFIRKFVKTCEQLKEKHHFHLVLDGQEKMYLDWLKFHKGKSQSGILRKEVREKMEGDKDYQKYLKFLK